MSHHGGSEALLSVCEEWFSWVYDVVKFEMCLTTATTTTTTTQWTLLIW